jgi:hypothetical protein
VFAALFNIAFFPKSSSELWSSKGLFRFGFGEYSGGNPGEACEGSDGMTKKCLGYQLNVAKKMWCV